MGKSYRNNRLIATRVFREPEAELLVDGLHPKTQAKAHFRERQL